MGSQSEAVAASHAPREVQDKAYKIRTFSNLLVDPWNLQVEDVLIEDIAHALSNETRYSGHLKQGFYSVAQHSLIVAEYFDTPELRLAGLLHDAEEAYFKDIPSPIKRRPEMAAFVAAADAARKVIFTRFGLCDNYDELMAKVHVVDDLVYHRERRSFDGLSVDKPIIPQPSGRFEAKFLTAFHNYRIQLQRQAA